MHCKRTIASAAIVMGLLATSASFVFAEDLSDQVLIRRDEFGVPHILAETEEAASFGYGYAQAEDRILTTARQILQARSEESRYFGKAFVRSDFYIRQFGMYQGAEIGYAKTPPWYQRILDAFAGGYNLYIEKHRSELPEWVKPFTAVDILANGRRMYIMEFYMRDIGAVIGKLESNQPLPGSNVWAIGKERSASGNSLLLGNPHLPWFGGYLFHEAHITVPGKINFYGGPSRGFPEFP